MGGGAPLGVGGGGISRGLPKHSLTYSKDDLLRVLGCFRKELTPKPRKRLNMRELFASGSVSQGIAFDDPRRLGVFFRVKAVLMSNDLTDKEAWTTTGRELLPQVEQVRVCLCITEL
jgi:hypothetical protein